MKDRNTIFTSNRVRVKKLYEIDLTLSPLAHLGFIFLVISSIYDDGFVLAQTWRHGENVMVDATKPSGEAVRFTSPFEPDILTTHKFFRVFRQKGQFEPEEKLMFAVLTDAVDCFQKYLGANSRKCRRLFAEAESWIKSRESRWPYSFEHICQALNISPSYLRIGLMRWRAAHEGNIGRRKRIREPLRYHYRVKKTA